MKINLMLLALLALATACGGGGGGGGGGGKDDGDEGAQMSGVLVDSKIANVKFSTNSGAGVTGANGTFSCKAGETVTFSLTDNNGMDLTLGSVTCRAVVSPIEIVTQGSATIDTDITSLSASAQTKVVRMLRLLQSLDSDNDPTNGITIVNSNVTTLGVFLQSQGYDVEDGLEELLGDDADVDDTEFSLGLAAAMTAMGRTGDEVSETDAKAHFQTTQSACSASSCNTGSGSDDEDEDEDEDNGGGTGGSTATISYCMEGHVMGPIETDKTGYSVIDPLTGDTNGFAVAKTDAQVHLMSDGTAVLYRYKGGGEDNVSSHHTYTRIEAGGWSQSGDKTQLNVTGIVYSNISSYLKWDTSGFTLDEIISTGITSTASPAGEFSIQPGSYGDDSDQDLVWTIKSTGCVAPTSEDADVI